MDYTQEQNNIIDLILVSDPAKISQSGVIEIGVSDHFLTYCSLESSKVQTMSVGITCICTYEMRFNIRPKTQKPTIMKHKSKKIKTNQLNFGKH